MMGMGRTNEHVNDLVAKLSDTYFATWEKSNKTNVFKAITRCKSKLIYFAFLDCLGKYDQKKIGWGMLFCPFICRNETNNTR